MHFDRSSQLRSLDDWSPSRGAAPGNAPVWPASPYRNAARIRRLGAAFESEGSRIEIRGLSEEPRRALDGSLDEWFEAAAWSVMNVLPRRALFRGSLAFLEEGAELGLSHAHRKLEMLGPALVELIEAGRMSASTQKTIVSALTLMLVKNEAFRSRHLASYSAAAGRVINAREVPIPFKSRLLVSVHLLFSSRKLTDHESGLLARLLNSILDSLFGILDSRCSASCKLAVLYLLNTIASNRMPAGTATVPPEVLCETYTRLLAARAPAQLRERALSGCAHLRRQAPDVVPLVIAKLEGEYDAVIETLTRPGRRRGRHRALEAVLRHVRLSGIAPRESRQKLGTTLVSLVSHSRDYQSIQTSLKILASDRFWPEMASDEHARFRSAIESLVLDGRPAQDVRHAAINILSRWEPAIKGPPVVLNRPELPHISLASLLESVGGGECRRIGRRSLRVDLHNRSGECLLVKTVPPGADVSGLLRECFWLEYLGRRGCERPWGDARFDIPRLVNVTGQNTFALSGADFPVAAGDPDGPRPAIGLVASSEYFDYVNASPRDACRPEGLTEVLPRGAYLLGALFSQGIIHCDVIPLFHRNLRRPPIPFQWWRGGRICSWPAFCRYPNMGSTGIRDFEHFISWNHDPAPEGYSGPGAIYKLIGGHILSLLLLAGSALRDSEDPDVEVPAKAKASGDFRARFELLYLRGLLRTTFGSYYRGLTGLECPFSDSIDWSRVAAAARDTMGHDLRMSSRFRKEDQMTVNADEFRDTLRRGGYTSDVIEGIEQGRHDLYVIDGPHLEEGSTETLPAELRRAVEGCAALCVVGLLRAKGVANLMAPADPPSSREFRIG